MVIVTSMITIPKNKYFDVDFSKCLIYEVNLESEINNTIATLDITFLLINKS